MIGYVNDLSVKTINITEIHILKRIYDDKHLLLLQSNELHPAKNNENDETKLNNLKDMFQQHISRNQENSALDINCTNNPYQRQNEYFQKNK